MIDATGARLMRGEPVYVCSFQGHPGERPRVRRIYYCAPATHPFGEDRYHGWFHRSQEVAFREFDPKRLHDYMFHGYSEVWGTRRQAIAQRIAEHHRQIGVLQMLLEEA